MFMQRRLRAPSPALVISLVALFVALGGTTYAATSLPTNSVGSSELRTNAVTNRKIKNGAVTYRKLNNPMHWAMGYAKVAESALTANEVNGVRLTGFHIDLPPNSPLTSVFLDGPGMAFSADCQPGTLHFYTHADHGFISASLIDDTGHAHFLSDSDFKQGDDFAIPIDSAETGTIEESGGALSPVSITLQIDKTPGGDCFTSGHVLQSALGS